MTPFSRLRIGLVGLLLSIATTLLAAPVRFDIPAQPAQSALRAFNAQSGSPAVFVYDELAGVKTNEVHGVLEPVEALRKLLEGTGFETTVTSVLVVRRAARAPPPTGALRGTMLKADGKPPGDVRVIIRETGQTMLTDDNGEFAFPALAAGTYVLIATAEGYQTLHVTDVVVRAGTDTRLGAESLRRAADVAQLQPYVVRAQFVAPKEVRDAGLKPTNPPSRNVDRPRTRDDAQPYYIFDQAALEQSGAVNLEEFLKRRVSMNASTETSGQAVIPQPSRPASNTVVDLRGFGAGSTLVLVNGRRWAATATNGVLLTAYPNAVYTQANLNGIPLAAVERVEVLPSSASGIYGGNAVGGVVNIVLKSQFSGLETRADYGATSDGAAPRRSVSALAGGASRDDRTHWLVVASYDDVRPPTLADRPELLERYRSLVRDHPDILTAGVNPSYPIVPLGSTVNIASADGSNLRLKSTDVSLNSPIATLPSNYAFTTTRALGENVIAGQWNAADPDTNQGPNGRAQALGLEWNSRAFMGTLDHQLTDRLEVYAEVSSSRAKFSLPNSPLVAGGVMPVKMSVTNGYNPFAQDILISVPVSFDQPGTNETNLRGLVVGASLRLGANWTAALDYTWSQNRTDLRQFGIDGRNLYEDPVTALGDGLVNPFDSTPAGRARLESALAPFYTVVTSSGESTLNDLLLRASGPALRLPAGDVTLSGALEHRKEGVPDLVTISTSSTLTYQTNFLLGPGLNVNRTVGIGQTQSNDSAYLEALVPFVSPEYPLPGVRRFDLQLSARFDRATVGVGPSRYNDYPLIPGSPPDYGGLPGFGVVNSPARSTATYSSLNGVAGFRYQPVDGLTLRTAYATAFLPPTAHQLSPVAEFAPSTPVYDPATGGDHTVYREVVGNPQLKPQTSTAWDAGVIWQPPSSSPLAGLRLGVQYSQIEQRDVIAPLPASSLIANPAKYPTGRVVFDSTVNMILLVVVPLENLLRIDSSYWDLSASFRRETNFGALELSAMATFVDHVTLHQPEDPKKSELAGFPSDGGPIKVKSNVSATWEGAHWSAGWAVDYFGSYHEAGADAKGLGAVGSDLYHDAFAGYRFDSRTASAPESSGSRRWLSGVSVQLAVKNVFNRLPAFDAYNAPFYSSYSGDLRLREFVLTVKKRF